MDDGAHHLGEAGAFVALLVGLLPELAEAAFGEVGRQRFGICAIWHKVQKPAKPTVDIDAIVLGEMHENELRKDFTVSERVAIGKAVEQAIGERRGRPVENVQEIAQLPKGQKTREEAAEKSGFGNAETYRQAKAIVENGAPELVEAVDAGKISIHAAEAIATLPHDEQVVIAEGAPADVITPSTRSIVSAAQTAVGRQP